MKKIFIVMALIFCTFFCSSASAESYSFSDEQICETITDEAQIFLDRNNITPENNGAASLSFLGVLESILNLLSEKAVQPLKVLGMFCGAVLLCALGGNIAPDSSLKGLVPAVGALCGAGICAAAVLEVVGETLEIMSAAANFMLVFIPSFAGISAALGYTATASAVNSAVIAASQLFSQICVNLLAPLCATILGLSIAGAVHPELKTDKIGEMVKKFTVWGLSLTMTVFMGVLSAQTAVTSTADGTAIKAAKFLVSQGVPIVGGTISEAVNTVGGGLEILKSSLGTYGIIAAAAIILPILAALVCYSAVFSAAQAFSEMFDIKPLAALAKCCSQIMSIIIAICGCFLLLNFISTVLLLAMTK